MNENRVRGEGRGEGQLGAKTQVQKAGPPLSLALSPNTTQLSGINSSGRGEISGYPSKGSAKRLRALLLLILVAALLACQNRESGKAEKARPSAIRPSILLVTLDTTRADAMGPEAQGVETPAFNLLAKRGLRFTQAYATVPQTLSSHTSMMTGLYPAGHGIHENGRYVSPLQALLAERLHSAGYRTAAFVSAFALARRFGLARGFDQYDDQNGEERSERSSRDTTDRAVAFLRNTAPGPLFLWVHYYDPHFPYAPSEPFRTRYAEKPYLGEVAAMDQQLGRLVEEFQKRPGGPAAIVVVGDHGEGLGEHGEAQHGNLLYQSTMHVPLLVSGPGIGPGVRTQPVSTRRVFQTVLDWAGIDASSSLRLTDQEVVVGEAMKPFLDYGWRPQVMAVEGRMKTISAGRIEVYDVIADPHETTNLVTRGALSRPVRSALQEYPVPSIEMAAASSPVPGDDEARRKLASLGYVASQTRPLIRKDAPVPVDMAFLFDTLDRSSGLFVRERYGEAIPLLEKILVADPMNLDACLHLAVAHSSLGHAPQALAAFHRAAVIAPDSSDVKTYLGLYYARGGEWLKAAPLLEEVVRREPERLPALEGLAAIREKQGRVAEAVHLRQSIYERRTAKPEELIRLGDQAMSVGDTEAAISAFSKAKSAQGHDFQRDLEIGVLYLSAHRLEEARDALNAVPSTHPDYAMALFKRAQVSVLLGEQDAPARIANARDHADAVTRELIARERLFR